MKNQLKILVACHKPGPYYQDEIYLPIHVGRALSKNQTEMANMIGDDTGDNISEKNLKYCELTAQYWAWKNLHDVEYVGFCHYRRYFPQEIVNNLTHIFRNHDIILIKNTLWYTVEDDLVRYVTEEDLTIFLKILKKNHPEYEGITLKYLLGIVLYSYNMMICRKELFDDYAKWLFPLLSECEKYMRESPYSRGRRALAYLGEYFMPVYMLYHHYRIYATHSVNPLIKETTHIISNPLRRRLQCYNDLLHYKIKRYHFKALYRYTEKPESFEDYYNIAILTGLENDGIKIE